MANIRKIPNNIEAERSVLGAILIDSSVANDAFGILRKEDFYIEANQFIFQSMFDLAQENSPIDPIAVEDKLSQLGVLEKVGGIEYILALSNYLPSSANFLHYVDILKRTSLSRTIIRRCTKIIEAAYNESDSKKVLTFAEKQIFSISENLDKSSLQHIRYTAEETMQKINKACRGEYDGSGTKTDFKPLDILTNGLHGGDLVLLAARPATGKTAFALNIATNVGLKGQNVAVFSLEMPAIQLTQRIMSSVSLLNIRDALKKGVDAVSSAKLLPAYEKIVKSQIYIDDSSMNTPTDILSKCRRLKRERKGLDLIVVDYLQLMSTGKSTDNRQQEVSEMSRSMKIIAKELDVPILLLSQLSRAVESRKDGIPMLSDLRESGAIEQDADIVMFLHKPYLTDNTLPPNEVNLIVAKHRNGELATIPLHWTGEFMRFDSVNVAKPKNEILGPPVVTSPDQMKNVSTEKSPFDTPVDAPINDAPSFEINEQVAGEADEIIIQAPVGEPLDENEKNKNNGDLPF